MASTENLLFYRSLNETSNQSILFIHGAFTDGHDWDLVVPHLAEYHLIIPDLPGHGQSKEFRPFSVNDAVDRLARLIILTALGGRAHVVGHSLGAKIGIALASARPDIVKDVVVSGFEVYPPNALTPYLPYVVWAEQRVENAIPRPLIRWLMDGTDVRRSNISTSTLALCRDITSPMQETVWPLPWSARTLVIAAGKGGIVPSADHPHDAKKLAKIGREKNEATIAVTHPRMRHPWNRQEPGLFAETVKAWIERQEYPDGFVVL